MYKTIIIEYYKGLISPYVFSGLIYPFVSTNATNGVDTYTLAGTSYPYSTA
mgnify:CR=1 FL=1